MLKWSAFCVSEECLVTSVPAYLAEVEEELRSGISVVENNLFQVKVTHLNWLLKFKNV